MKKEQEQKFLLYLETQNNWCPAIRLADHFNVSTRTIRKYVSELNERGPVILSSPEGYKLLEKGKLSSYADNLTQIERVRLIVRSLIIHPEGIDLFDLSDSLFLSVSSIENDIVFANKLLSEIAIKIQHRKNLVVMVGDEKDKRKAMSTIIYYETARGFLNLNIVQSAFPDYDVPTMKEAIVGILRAHNLLINDYSINNIILHLLITIDRIKSHNMIEKPLYLADVKNNLEMQAANKIADHLEKICNIPFNESERYNLVFLIASKTTLLNYQSLNSETLTDYMEEKYVSLCQKILESIHNRYFIDIQDDEFFIKFALHVRNLIYRAKNEQISRNPFTNKLKTAFPLIYELAVFISNQIQLSEGIRIEEDEISYIAFHLGSYFERKKNQDNKILCAVISPNYYDMQVQLTQNLENRFRDSIEIIRITSDTSELQNDDTFDIIISTLPMKKETIPVVFVHPYLTESDYENIQIQLNRLSKKKDNFRVKQYLSRYLDKELFMKNVYLANAEAYITYMSDVLYEKCYVTEDYGKYALEREKLSSTAFNNKVAIPHSMHMDENKTGIFFILLDRPIVWGTEKVQIIAMISINREQRKLFSTFFESLINLLSEWENVKQLIAAKDYNDFMHIMEKLLDRYL